MEGDCTTIQEINIQPYFYLNHHLQQNRARKKKKEPYPQKIPSVIKRVTKRRTGSERRI